jgi:hypothetical protein
MGVNEAREACLEVDCQILKVRAVYHERDNDPRIFSREEPLEFHAFFQCQDSFRRRHIKNVAPVSRSHEDIVAKHCLIDYIISRQDLFLAQ